MLPFIEARCNALPSFFYCFATPMPPKKRAKKPSGLRRDEAPCPAPTQGSTAEDSKDEAMGERPQGQASSSAEAPKTLPEVWAVRQSTPSGATCKSDMPLADPTCVSDSRASADKPRPSMLATILGMSGNKAPPTLVQPDTKQGLPVSRRARLALKRAASTPDIAEEICVGDGFSILNEASNIYACRLASEAYKRLQHCPNPFRVATGCSGTDVWAECVFKAFEHIGGAGLPRITPKVVFGCESNCDKQNYLLKLDHFQNDSDTCLFDDIKLLGEPKAFCVRHGKMCTVRTVDSWCCGFSCTAVSHANPNAADALGTLNDDDASNASALTFQGNMNYVKAHRPLMVTNENVEGLDDTGIDESTVSNLEIVKHS